MHADSIHSQKKKMKDLPLQSRPREKLMLKGSENISDAEVLAILLGTGTKDKNVLLVAKQLIRKYPLNKLAQVSIAELEKIPGVGKVKASHIQAALELGRRVFASVSLTKAHIYSTQDAIAVCRDIAQKRQEHMLVLYINARHELLQKEVIGMGNLNTLVIEPKEIFSPALTSPCAEIIIVHNHPSGDPMPSEEDIRFTTRVHDAGQIMGIALVDHIIVSSSGYFSFREGDEAGQK